MERQIQSNPKVGEIWLCIAQQLLLKKTIYIYIYIYCIWLKKVKETNIQYISSGRIPESKGMHAIFQKKSIKCEKRGRKAKYLKI